VPADGFFEWQKQGKLRQPFLIRRKDQAPFAFAGLWERWKNRSDGTVVRSCTIITCALYWVRVRISLDAKSICPSVALSLEIRVARRGRVARW